MIRTSVLSLACLTALLACDAPPPAPTTSSAGPAKASTRPRASAAVKPSAVASAQPAPLKVTAPKAYAATDAQALGTLPDGVGIAVGKPAPDFELPAADGKKLALKSVLAKGPALLVFYRGGW